MATKQHYVHVHSMSVPSGWWCWQMCFYSFNSHNQMYFSLDLMLCVVKGFHFKANSFRDFTGTPEGPSRTHVNSTREDVFQSVSLPGAFFSLSLSLSLSLHFQQRSSSRNPTFGSGTFHILGFSSTINGKLAYNTVTYRQADIPKTNTGAHLRRAQNAEGSLTSAFKVFLWRWKVNSPIRGRLLNEFKLHLRAVI